MKICKYIENYTAGNHITLKHVFDEVNEFIHEVVNLNKIGASEELQDVFHFLQLWLYWRFRIDGEIWKITKDSVNKFMQRRKVWEIIYTYVGLDKNISKFCGNYKREEKVIKHLAEFNISKEKAITAYREIVLKHIVYK